MSSRYHSVACTIAKSIVSVMNVHGGIAVGSMHSKSHQVCGEQPDPIRPAQSRLSSQAARTIAGSNHVTFETRMPRGHIVGNTRSIQRAYHVCPLYESTI